LQYTATFQTKPCKQLLYGAEKFKNSITITTFTFCSPINFSAVTPGKVGSERLD